MSFDCGSGASLHNSHALCSHLGYINFSLLSFPDICNAPPPAQTDRCSADLTHIALPPHCSQSLHCGSLFIAPRSRAFRLLTNPALFCSPKRSSAPLPVECSYPLCSSSASCLFSSLALDSQTLLVSNCNTFPQHRPALEGLHNTTSVTPFLDTSILCSDRNNLPKLVPGFYASLFQRFSLKELGHWLLRCISVLKTLKADETTTYV